MAQLFQHPDQKCNSQFCKFVRLGLADDQDIASWQQRLDHRPAAPVGCRQLVSYETVAKLLHSLAIVMKSGIFVDIAGEYWSQPGLKSSTRF